MSPNSFLTVARDVNLADLVFQNENMKLYGQNNSLKLDSGRFSSGQISSHLHFFFQLLPQLILNTGKKTKLII